jgi:N-formylglutamate amidohydrolase
MRETAFEIVEPEHDSPVLVEVPHAGLVLDPESAWYLAAPTHCVARDADLYVDELFAGSADAGATLLFARTSRYVVDLNRAEDDYDSGAVVGGPPGDRPRGAIWRLTSEGLPVLRERLPTAEYERRCHAFHRPYHEAITHLLERKRQRFGFAVMLCAHSMPSPRGRGAIDDLADVVPGTRGRSTADGRFIDVVDAAAAERSWRVQHDMPYRGGYSTGHYGRPQDGLHAVQIEIARRLYMDEQLARDVAGFAEVMSFARDLVSRLVAEAELAHREQVYRNGSATSDGRS